jgi:hypothetical protein
MTSDIDKIAQRNSLRREAGLPALSVPTELAKLETDRAQAAFEREFELSRHRLKHLWTNERMGWLSRMGPWIAVHWVRFVKPAECDRMGRIQARQYWLPRDAIVSFAEVIKQCGGKEI